MSVDDKLQLVQDYIDRFHEESRASAARQYIAEDGTVTVNGEEMTRSEYISTIEESDRFFLPTRTEIDRVVAEGDEIVILARSEVEQVGPAYGIEPSDEVDIEEYSAVFHRIVDGKIVRLDVVVDQATKFQQLGLLSEDPTKEQLKDQYYQVLNRVLRHDLRNRLNVIRLVADSLAEDNTDDPVSAGVKIRRVVGELLQTTDKARSLERMAINTPLEPTTFPVDSLVEPVLETCNESLEYNCTASYPEDAPVITTDKKLCWNALSELLENAIVYNDADDPQVTVDVRSVEETRYECELRVEDNGPGISDDVLRPVTENKVTKLLHGSGIGLWIVKWCVTRLDGDLAFEDRDSGGTRVRLLLPNLE
jgi:signal transduction histidine kinase